MRRQVKLPKQKNERFINLFRQEAEDALLNPTVKNEISKIRRWWGIPSNGFILKSNSKEFYDWVDKQEQNDFQKASIIFDSCKRVKAKPRYFLIKVLAAKENDEFPDTLYMFEGLEAFDAIIHEKPFPGIVYYLLFNELFIPETNGLQLSVEFHNEVAYPVVRFGPNATAEDHRQMLLLIDWLQKNLKGYKKGRVRVRKNDRSDKEIFTKQLKGYEALEEVGIPDTQHHKLSMMRKRRHRFKKRVGS